MRRRDDHADAAAAGSGVTAAVAINARLSSEDADHAVTGARGPTTQGR